MNFYQFWLIISIINGVRKIDFLVGRNGGVGGWWVNPSMRVPSYFRLAAVLAFI